MSLGLNFQDTLKSKPAENKVMKRASMIGISTATTIYIICGCVGYGAFGNLAPGNLLTGFGFYEPFWLIDLANVFIVIHLVGAYQVLHSLINSIMIFIRVLDKMGSFYFFIYSYNIYYMTGIGTTHIFCCRILGKEEMGKVQICKRGIPNWNLH